MVGELVDVSVIVPTYREALNLPTLIPRIAAALADAGMKGEIIVVDDDSRDGTEEVCTELSRRFPVRLITRLDEKGLASAVLCGLRAARGEILVVMDADLSHPPESIAELVWACRSPFIDFVIGSRYVAGGAVDKSWGLFRRLNSRAATLLARGLTDARDPMAGFFAIKQTKFRTATDLRPLGYKIGLELVVRCNCRRVVEKPIEFTDRVRGESKLTITQQWMYLRHLGRLYAAKYAGTSNFIRFGVVGLSGMAADLLAFSMLLPAVGLALARLSAIGVAMSWNFLLHRRVTFRSAARRPLLSQYASFCGACLLGAAINGGVSLALCASSSWFAVAPTLAAAVGVLAGAVANFAMCRRWVFPNDRSTEVKEPTSHAAEQLSSRIGRAA